MDKKIRVAEGTVESGVIAGNYFDKYHSKSPVARWFVRRFDSSLNDFVQQAAPETIYEVGCGEGYWTLQWAKEGFTVRGSDFSEKVIAIAKENAAETGLDKEMFSVRDIYSVSGDETADLIVCCEVLEHLEDPERALCELQKLVSSHLILSVPREPLWSIMNMARGKYITSLGNTPGHIQRWSAGAFVKLVSSYFKIIAVRKPLPWTMLLCVPMP